MTPHERDQVLAYVVLALLVCTVVTAAVVLGVLIAEHDWSWPAERYVDE